MSVNSFFHESEILNCLSLFFLFFGTNIRILKDIGRVNKVFCTFTYVHTKYFLSRQIFCRRCKRRATNNYSTCPTYKEGSFLETIWCKWNMLIKTPCRFRYVRIDSTYKHMLSKHSCLLARRRGSPITAADKDILQCYIWTKQISAWRFRLNHS